MPKATISDHHRALPHSSNHAAQPLTSSLTDRLLLILFVVYGGGIFFPHWLAAALEITLVGAAFLLLPRTLRMDRASGMVAIWALTIPSVWLVLGLNPNIPSWNIALLGVRKSTMVFVGIALGVALAQSAARRKTATIITCVMTCILVASILIHSFVPEVEAGIDRRASITTATFQGSPRLQGMTAGPFHAALLSTTVALIGWHTLRWRGRNTVAALPLLGIGVLGISMSQVRTAYLVTGVGMLILTIGYSRYVGRRARQIILLTIVGLAVGYASTMAYAPPKDAALASIAGLAEDQRARVRVERWHEAIVMASSSPIYGWGPGSAGDTLGTAFVRGNHITAHNVFLKYLVEGGVTGMCLLLGIAIILARRIAWKTRAGQLATIALIGILGFGVTGSAVEALPITLFLGVLIGLSIRSKTRAVQVAAD